MIDLMLEHDDDIDGFTPRCPECRSTHIDEPNVARRFGGAIGAIAGTTSGVALALTGAEIGLLAGPIGAVLAAAAGVVIDGIVSGAAGCAAGSRLGRAIDQTILHNQHCRACGHRFSDESS
jgi:hypothetical protein